MNILGISAAFLIACLAGLGVGGGGLFIVYLTIFENMAQYEAQGINLIFFIASALASLIIHLKKRNINIKETILIAVLGSLGAMSGCLITNIAQPELIRRIFGILLIFCGAFSFIGVIRNNYKNVLNYIKNKIN